MANPAARFGLFITGVREELKQVSWPGRDELVGSVIVVFVGACDFFLSKAAQLLWRQ